MRFRLLTYNIHKGIGGVDRRYRPDRVIAVIRSYKADVVFLQEVDDGVPRSRFDRQAELVAGALDYDHCAFQDNVSLSRGCYGNAILSRFPLEAIEHLNLTVPLKKRRRALIAQCTLPGKREHTLLLVNTHLGLAAYERKIQVQRLLDHIAERHGRRADSTVIGGDFNDVWRSLAGQLMEPAGYRAANSRAPTFPAVLPLRDLDHVYYRGALRSKHSFVGHSGLARQASDHLPLVIDFVARTRRRGTMRRRR